MSLFARNASANLVSKVWVTLLQLAITPLFLAKLGVTSFGIVGFFTIIQAIIALLNAGLTSSLNRGIATLSNAPEKSKDLQDFVRTLETVCWACTGMVATIICLAASSIATDWLNAPESLSRDLPRIIRAIGVTAALSFPFDFYSTVLLGLQHQVRNAVLSAVSQTLRLVGALAVLSWSGNSLNAFFLWQLGTAAAQTVAGYILAWSAITGWRFGGRFQATHLIGTWRFMLAVTGTTALGAVLTQADRLFISKSYSLDRLSEYTIASSLSTGLYVLVGAISTAAYPRLTSMSGSAEEARTIRLYHAICQTVSCIVFPVTLVMFCFPTELLFAWTNNAQVAKDSAPLLKLLVIGAALNSLFYVPYSFQLAKGWTKLGFWHALVSSLFLVGLIFSGNQYFGLPGVAGARAAVYALGLPIGIWLMHRRIARGEMRDWILRDTVMPFCLSAVPVLLARTFVPATDSRLAQGLLVLVTAGLAMVLAAMACPEIRNFVQFRIKSRA